MRISLNRLASSHVAMYPWLLITHCIALYHGGLVRLAKTLRNLSVLGT